MNFNNKYNTAGFKKYLSNTVWLFSEKIVRIVISLLVGVMITRYLNPVEFGIYSYVQSFVGLFLLIANLGIDEILVREIIENKHNNNELLNTSLFLKFGGFIVMCCIISLCLWILHFEKTSLLYIYIITFSALFQCFNVIELYFQSKVMGKQFSTISLFTLFLTSLLKVLFVLFECELVYFFVLITIDSLIIAVAQIIVFSRITSFKFNYRFFNKDIALYLLKNSWPLIFTGIVVSLYMKIDQIMIMEMLTPQAVGEYAAAVKISEAWYFIPTIITISIFPAIMSSRSDYDKYMMRLKSLYKLLMVLAIFISVIMTFFSNHLILLLYGTNFQNSGNVLMVHIWSSIFVFIGVANSKWFIAENMQHFYVINTAIGALLNIILNYILIPKYGIVGSAWATLISYFFAAYFCLSFFRKTRSQFFFISKCLFN